MLFTAQQLEDWKDYERVRKSGEFDMLDPRAIGKSGLSIDAYNFVILNFSELEAAVKKVMLEEIEEESSWPECFGCGGKINPDYGKCQRCS